MRFSTCSNVTCNILIYQIVNLFFTGRNMTWVIFTAVVLLIALTSGPGLFAASTWAEKRWEARYDACEQVRLKLAFMPSMSN